MGHANLDERDFGSAMDWKDLLSPARLGVPALSQPAIAGRSEYQRDFDRIIFSSAFRRLQDKTQVFPLAESDYVRTRLTHSLEASSVGRSLGTLVGAALMERYRDLSELRVSPSDFGAIVAAACLAHDIGNPPFGHSGEDAIRLFFETHPTGQQLLASLSEEQRADFLRFEGNAQGFRILTRLQSPDNQGGLQLTFATLGAFTKYPRTAFYDGGVRGVSTRKHGFLLAEHEHFVKVAQGLKLAMRDESVWVRHPLAYLVEAADDICYHVVDVEDAYRLGILRYGEVEAVLAEIIDDEGLSSRLATMGDDKGRIEYLRARSINALVEQAALHFLDVEAELRRGQHDAPLLADVKATQGMQALRALGEERIYMAPPVVEIEAAGFEVLAGLLAIFSGAIEAQAQGTLNAKERMRLKLIPAQFFGPDGGIHTDAYQRLLRITDFVSGMTDSYAVSLFKKVTGISLPGG
ncbi:MAG: deoxyguanosinetriphosphate triphosphohydrolase [Acidiferrobacter sp.]